MDGSQIILRLIAAVLTVAAFLFLFWLFKRIADNQAKKSATTYACPRCYSTDITYLKHHPSDTPFVGSLRSRDYFLCNTCGFEGIFPLVDKAILPSLRKKQLKPRSKKKSVCAPAKRKV